MYPKEPAKKKRRQHAASILQEQGDHNCLLCALLRREETRGIHQHHVFGGTANREKSEKWGIKAWLCLEHHEGRRGVHNDRKTDLFLKQHAQQVYENLYSHEQFMAEFGRNYL